MFTWHPRRNRQGTRAQKKRCDPIPPSVKKHFFTGVEMPNFTKDYDAIGFDADHCLVKYNVQEIFRLTIRSQMDDWHKHEGYPEEILKFDISPSSE